MATSIFRFKSALAASTPLGLCIQLLLASANPAEAQLRFPTVAPGMNPAITAAILKANGGGLFSSASGQGAVQDSAPVAQDHESAANERIRMAEIAAQREQTQLQTQQAIQEAQAQQTQGWVQLGVGLLGSLLQSRQQAASAAPQPDLAQLQQLILDQQAQIKALQQQQLPQTAQSTAAQ